VTLLWIVYRILTEIEDLVEVDNEDSEKTCMSAVQGDVKKVTTVAC